MNKKAGMMSKVLLRYAVVKANLTPVQLFDENFLQIGRIKGGVASIRPQQMAHT